MHSTPLYPRSSAACRHGSNDGSFSRSPNTQFRFSRIAVPEGPRPAGVSDQRRSSFSRYPLSCPAYATGRIVFSSSCSAYAMPDIRYPPTRTMMSQIWFSKSCSLFACASTWLQALSARNARFNRRSSSLISVSRSEWPARFSGMCVLRNPVEGSSDEGKDLEGFVPTGVCTTMDYEIPRNFDASSARRQ